jgi:hypothetical protein
VGSLALVTVTLLAMLVAFELVLRMVWPQPYMTPTYMYSDQYINSLFPNTTMVEEMPGEWKFTYAINSYGYRGKLVKPSNKYLKRNIVVLGDSYAFGEGVDEGAQYSAVLDRELNGQYDVINLAVPGWGLTQEIRRYFEFGTLFNPRVVILQFTSNDPVDNLSYPVTTAVDGRFIFSDDNRIKLKRLNTLLADSWIQRLQVYNLVKKRLWEFYFSSQRSKLVAEKNESNPDVAIPFEEMNYVTLLELFVQSLTENKTQVIFLPVGESLHRFPYIAKAVKKIAETNAFFKLVETGQWFKGVEDYSSPEGHAWGGKAHQIIGRNLAKFIIGLAG